MRSGKKSDAKEADIQFSSLRQTCWPAYKSRNDEQLALSYGCGVFKNSKCLELSGKWQSRQRPKFASAGTSEAQNTVAPEEQRQQQQQPQAQQGQAGIARFKCDWQRKVSVDPSLLHSWLAR